MTAPYLLRGVDIAAFAVALVDRLHSGGVVVCAAAQWDSSTYCVADWPGTRTQLYWAARLTLVNRVEDIAAFDAVFEAVFADAVLGMDPQGLKRSLGTTAAADAGVPGRQAAVADGGLPWSTLPGIGDSRPTPMTASIGHPRHPAQPNRGTCRRTVRSIRPDELRLLGRVAGTSRRALAAAPQHAP